MRRRDRGAPVHGGLVVKHGTRQAYLKHKCRCDDCSAAERDYYNTFVRYRRNPDIDEDVLRLPRVDGLPVGEWVRKAACRGLADRMEIPNFWHARRNVERKPEVLVAKRICAACPVLEQCRTWVLGHQADPCPAHVVAGMTKFERHDQRRQMGIPVSGRRTGQVA